ncbi:MAG: hypothetical protein K9H48_15480 [Melioribacteraceae bacterium]|nr:hypothetical protein [Melioribacteraceae bacterium]
MALIGNMLNRKQKKIEKLREDWGKPILKFRDYDLISSYHELLMHDKQSDFVDDKTWDDLELNSFFDKIDRNISGIGQQYLFHLLHKYEKDESILKNRFELISRLKLDQSLREKIQLKLMGISHASSYFISYIILSKSLPFSKYYLFFYLCPLLSIVSIFLIPFNGLFIFAALTVLLINLILNKIFSGKIYNYFAGFSSLNSFINSAISISRIETTNSIEEIEFLKNNRGLLKSLKKRLGYFVIDKESLNDLVLIAVEYLNMFLLFDIIAYYRSVNTLIEHQNEINAAFKAVANLDACISVASYLHNIPNYSNPSFINSNVISFSKMYHPLIENAVSNTLLNQSKSALITGSNMSGKTTFIKTIGVNFILSRTLYFSHAESISLPQLIVKTAIRRNDNIGKGKSYFFVEIETIENFIKLSRFENEYLFLIDEIFRGTNTIERLASSTAVLKYLSSNNRVYVTTHDIELQELLNGSFNMFHFREMIENEKFFFDYIIQHGPCSNGNAIKLLEMMNYPVSIIDESRLIASKLSHPWLTRQN